MELSTKSKKITQVRVISIENDIVFAEFVEGEHQGKIIKIPLHKVSPPPKINDVLWHVEHHFWNVL